MSNSLDSFLTRIGDVTIERVTPRGSPRSSDQGELAAETTTATTTTTTTTVNNDLTSQTGNDDSSDLSSGESANGEHEKTKDTSQPDETEDVRSEGSGDDMDLDETIDTQIGVRMESERDQHSDESSPEDDTEPVNILDTLPLEGAPIEGQEVTEADLLGQVKDDDSESMENDKSESLSDCEDDVDGSKRRLDPDNPESTKKKQKKEDGNDDSASECETKAEKKLANMRRNIREVMDETQLDEATLSAQRQEMERLRRVQEQQRIIREVQRQIAINRQNNKTQTRVISLLQGKQNQGDTTISESTSVSPSSSSSSPSQLRLPSSVMLKVNSGASVGQTSPVNQISQLPRRPLEGVRWQKSGRGAGGNVVVGPPCSAQTSISRVAANRPQTSQNALQQRIRMMTPSVSISPVVPKKESLDRSEYYSDSDLSDVEAEEALHEKQLHTMRKVSGAPKSQKAAKGKDVVTISSSSESSDDDCIVLSDPSGGEETDNEDDPANSGMHTNDRYNLPDEHGRVLINVGHPDSEPDVYLAPQVSRIIKPHQIGGIRFLFDNIVESIERYKNSSGFGCILAHSMGLGKTLQVTSFCDIFFRCTTAKTVLCIMPINTLQNWLAEFNMWLPYEDPNLTDEKERKNVQAKQEIKDEITSDMSNISRPISTESAHRLGQEQPIMNESNPYNQQNYEMPQYSQDPALIGKSPPVSMQMHQNYPGMQENSIYGANVPYDSSKSDIHCDEISGRPNYGHNSQYPGAENRPQHIAGFSDIDNRGNPGGIYPGASNNPTDNIYPNYENSAPSQYPNYPPPPDNEMKKDIQSQSGEINVKIEPEDTTKKEESCGSKTETTEDKKTEKIETPFNVDAPIGVELRPRHFRLHILNDSHKTMAARARVIVDWQKNGGVLLIGYELYRQLSLKKTNKAKRKRNQPLKDTVDVEEDDKNKGLLDDMHGALVSPGPDLVICDEGHRIKNSHASISMALKQMRTKRRIVLTGYPLQNNLLEYWCMVDFVRPNYLGTKSEFCNMFERPIQNGQCIDSTPQDIRLMRYRAHVLHALLEGFVQRRSHTVLQISLPRKEEYILLVRMTPHQRKLYDIFMNQVVKTRAVPNPLKAFAVCCKIWNHPDILYYFLKKRQANEEDDLDLEETMGEKPTTGNKRAKARQPKGEAKKGKKVKETAKNKPAATVPPNSSSSSSNDNPDNADNTSKPGQFGNYPTPQVNNSSFQNPGQGGYTQGYQNYRGNEQSNFYRNDANHSGEYNERMGELYLNPSQQNRYGNQSQSFTSYPQQNPGYSTQNYPQNQQQSYIANSEQSGNPRFTSPPGGADFRPETGANGNYENPGMFPRPYGFMDQGRNYPPNLNQTANNYPQNSGGLSSNFQAPMPQSTSNVPINDYYGNNQPQNYVPPSESNNQMYPRTDNHQTMQNPPLGYSNNQQNQNPNNYNTPTNQPRGFSPNQPNAIHTPGHYSSTPANQSIPNIQHGYPANQTPSTPAPPIGYSPGQQQTTNQMSQNPPQSYNTASGTAPGQSPMRGYSGQQQTQNSQNQTTYPTSQGYQNDRQGPRPPTPNPVYTNSGQNPNTNYPPNQNQTAGASNYSGNPQQTQQRHGYPISQQNQSQSINYTGQQNQSSRINNPTEQQLYPTGQDYIDRQGRNPTPNPNANNYLATHTGNQTQNSMGIYTEGSQNSQGQFNKSSDDPYWQQRNYNQTGRPEQCNEQYFREPASSSNRYPNNYYPGQNYGNTGNYDAYPGSQSSDDAAKNQQTTMINRPPIIYDKGGKDKNSNAGCVPGQNLTQNITQNEATGFNGSDSQCMPGPTQTVGTLNLGKDDDKDKDEAMDKDKEDKSDDEILAKDEEKDSKNSSGFKEEPGIPYDWATDLMKGYVPGLIDASAKMTLFFCILEEAVRLGDRVLAFSQSLFTLNLIEDFLARNNLKYPDGRTESWVKNINYYRLDGSTSALEREKLINEFNINPKIHLFLVSTRAGSLGINLVGANRAIVFDASWNPCHDTQAVCRVYRYGQTKPCFVYRLVTDNCLERKIYDRQISKQGMADRVVDQCNPDAHLSLKEATTLSWDWEEDSQVQDFSQSKDSYTDEVMHCVLDRHSSLLTKQPFHHESLLVDRKDKKLSQAEKRLARRGYELEKMAANCSRPSYSYVPGNTATRAGGLQIRAIRGGDTGTTQKPVASVRPMQQRGATENLGNRGIMGSRWIPAEVWQRQGMSAQEMTLPLDVVIPTNSPDKGSIVLKAGQRVMVLKSPKGIYMQLESGKIIAIRTAMKLNQQKKDEEPKKGVATGTPRSSTKPEVSFPLRNNSAISIIPKVASVTSPIGPRGLSKPGYRPFGDKEASGAGVKRGKPMSTGATKPQVSLTSQVSMQRVAKSKQDQLEQSSVGDNSNSSDSQLRSDQRVEEVRLEDVVAEASSNPEYSPSNSNRDSTNDGDNSLQKQNDLDKSQVYVSADHLSGGETTSQTGQHEKLTTEDTALIDTNQGFQAEIKETTKAEENVSFGQEKRENDDIAIEETSPIISQTQTTVPVQQTTQSQQLRPPNSQRTPDIMKNTPDNIVSTSVTASTVPPAKERDSRAPEIPQGDTHGLAQGYPYAQYPRYYDYAERARALPSPYGSYFPGVPTHTGNPRIPVDTTPKAQSEVTKNPEERINTTSTYPQNPQSGIVPTSKQPEIVDTKNTENSSNSGLNTSNSSRDESHVPTAFSHPASNRYPGPYPPTPYDPYAQHYPPAPGSSAAYPPSGAPGYAPYGGPGYNPDYARMYSAFHGPPPPAAADYMHRAYAPPPSSHPTNYYPPFPHPPPPPYPNYTFLPPYPNPNMPGEPQPPTQ